MYGQLMAVAAGDRRRFDWAAVQSAVGSSSLSFDVQHHRPTPRSAGCRSAWGL